MSGKRGPKPKLTSADVVRIRQLIAQNTPDGDIAKLFGVSRTMILRLRHQLATEPIAERAMNPLELMVAQENVRRAKRNEIRDAYHDGDSEQLSRLWDEYLEWP
jgi:hypothetical protein